VNGVFVALADKFNVNGTTVDGRIIGGANQDFQLVSNFVLNAPPAVPEPSTWTMMLLGSAGLGFAGYRKAKGGRTARIVA